MQKVAGVEKVEVRLNQGLTVLDLKPGNGVTLASLRQVIRNSGFTTPDARVIALGTISMDAGRLVFDVSGSRERFPLVASEGNPRVFDELKSRAATGSQPIVEVSGTIQLAAKGGWPLAPISFRVP